LNEQESKMTEHLKRGVAGRVVIALGTLLIAGCEVRWQQAEVAPAMPATNAAPAVNVTEEMSSILAKADQVDGTADKTVANCAVCLLGMAGSSEHTLAVGDYTLRFCSDHCKQTFAEDVSKSVLAIEFPNEKSTESP
jgi:predicted regulator of Ras-like GTPase activity (Roadblock/LC7/MglB family)